MRENSSKVPPSDAGIRRHARPPQRGGLRSGMALARPSSAENRWRTRDTMPARAIQRPTHPCVRGGEPLR